MLNRKIWLNFHKRAKVMKIAAIQTSPIIGDFAKNIEAHKKLIELSTDNGADLIFFPELSLTGYEPKLANELAISPDDDRLNDFQNISDAKEITIAVGVPIRAETGIMIGMIQAPLTGFQKDAR